MTEPLPNTRANDNVPARQLWRIARNNYYHDEYSIRGFESLHMLSIRYYERDLCRFSRELLQSQNGGLDPNNEKDKLAELRKLLEDYTKAVENLEITIAREADLPDTGFGRLDVPEEAPNDPVEIDKFCVENHRYDLRRGPPLDFVRTTLHRLLPNETKYEFSTAAQMKEAERARDEEAAYDADVQRAPTQKNWRRSERVDRLGRLIVAILGGAALLTPMLIMTYRTSQTSRLITVSVAVVVFGLILSLGTKSTNQEILGGSAAYAAVLVVYIGTATPTT